MKLIDKTIVVTGATSGIGRCLVEQLIDDNRVVAIGRSVGKLSELKHQLIQTDYNRELNDRFIPYVLDLNDPDQIKRCVENFINLNQVDVLINNAAVQFTPILTAQEFDVASIYQEIQTNFSGIVELTYWLLPLLNNSPRAFILNVNSGLALSPKTTSAVYCASKSALDSFSQSLSYQLENSSIGVLQAFLPLVETPMTVGRGDNKMSPGLAAAEIIRGLEEEKNRHYIGKVKLLVWILTFCPPLARRIMKRS